MSFITLLFLIERPELDNRKPSEIMAMHRENFKFPETPVWKPIESADECSLGQYDIETDHKYALLVLNYARKLAGFTQTITSEKSLDIVNNQLSRCALVNNKIGRLDHTINSSMPCYDDASHIGCATSNLITTGDAKERNSASNVVSYLRDPGVDSLGHRCACLNYKLKVVSFGRYQKNGAMKVKDLPRATVEHPPFFSWPPPGPVPFEFIKRPMFDWSFHVTHFSGKPVVTVKVNGNVVPLSLSKMMKNQKGYAFVKFVLSQPVTANTTYLVNIKDDKNEWQYKTTPIDSKYPMSDEQYEINLRDAMKEGDESNIDGGDSNGGSGKGSNNTVIIAVCVSVGAVAIIGGVVGFFIYRKKRMANQTENYIDV